MHEGDEGEFMREALGLARDTAGLASPNPQVGALVVRAGRIVGRGSHRYAERDHAEIAALREAGALARGATLYLNLEPCSHQGRTPPCTAAVIAAGIARVVAAMPDPNPRVAGAGFAQLRAAGVEVSVGCGAAEARRLNRAFARWIRTGRPFVTLKTALSLDGGVAARRGQRTSLTGPAAQRRVQSLRHESDALLTGADTVLIDDPLLTDRSGLPRRRPLLRVVVDARRRVPPTALLWGADPPGDVWIYPSHDFEALFAELGGRQITAVLVEAGPRLTAALLAGAWVDCLRLFYAPRLLGPAALRFATAPLGPWPGAAQSQAWGADLELSWLLRDPYA